MLVFIRRSPGSRSIYHRFSGMIIRFENISQLYFMRTKLNHSSDYITIIFSRCITYYYNIIYLVTAGRGNNHDNFILYYTHFMYIT